VAGRQVVNVNGEPPKHRATPPPNHPIAIVWSHRLRGAGGGLVLARESGHVLTWDTNHWLCLLNRRGEVQSQTRFDAGIVAGCIAEDGAASAVADDRGRVSWLTRELIPRWRHSLPHQPTALATDALGRGLTVADARGGLHFFDVGGRPCGPPLESPRPLAQIHFAPTAPILFGAAVFGLTAALDCRSGQWLWKDVPIVHLGTMAITDGPTVAVACYSEGVRRYDSAGRRLASLTMPEPCRFTAATYDGRFFLAGGVYGAVHGLDADGRIAFSHHFSQPLVSLALAPLGDWATLALSDGLVVGLDLAGVMR
jgi:hypothetical protein